MLHNFFNSNSKPLLLAGAAVLGFLNGKWINGFMKEKNDIAQDKINENDVLLYSNKNVDKGEEGGKNEDEK